MKISVAWLKELVGDFDPAVVAKQLTMAGFEVEAREKFAAVAGVVVARVVDKRPHPDASKLTLVDVDAGDGKKTQVVCGAPNVPAPGGLVLWARPGATLPMGPGGAAVTIGEKAVRGVTSPGMLCAEDELGIGTSHAGIVILDGNDGLAPGDDFAAKLSLPDEIWEVNVTPNRPDCLGHVGVAREVAALIGAPLKTDVSVLGHETDIDVSLPAAPARIEDAAGCPRLSALALEGVRIGPSPLAVRLRLQSLGVRAISNVVDATNLLLLGFGQPLHAYDQDKLDGGIVARCARAGEQIVTLDGQTRTLTAEDLVIADGRGAVGIAGVMGGAGSEVSPATTRLLLEAAHFAPARVRRTAKRLGLHTEAAHRFERGTDPSATALVIARLAGLILKLAGGRVASVLTDVYPQPIAPRTITLRTARTNHVLGTRVGLERQAAALRSIGLASEKQGADALVVTVPPFRPDLAREIDLVEEIARLVGYDHIPATLPRLEAPPGQMRAPIDERTDAARDALCGLGLEEVVTYGFVAPNQIVRLPDEERGAPVKLANPMGEERSVMRTSLVPGLALALARNQSRGLHEVRAYEVGAVFLPAPARPNEPPVEERWHAAALLYGHGDGWLKPGAALGFFDGKGVLEELGRALGHELACVPAASPRSWLHPHVQAEVHAGVARVGVVGELHPDFARPLGVELGHGLRPIVFEIDLQSLPEAPRSRWAELPRFPSVTRDISFLVDERVTAADIRRAIAAEPDPLRVDVRVLEDYRDAKLPAGKKGMLWSITYRAADRTLTDEDVHKAHQAMLDRITKALDLQLR